ncbi:hypothetical protein H5410_021273 [Solanum commersonii]|uniref:Uncharacterized protein n=1 Tax=Solanum commersonii TaxID=4109 RepID=A0A9J5ZDS5_SOLCO|nr:hypothetical protein H5410_021273 [Solanum commersonii]
MSSSSSPLEFLLSQEIETPSLFNFSIPPPEESPSMPVFGVGETAESITTHIEVVASPVLNSWAVLSSMSERLLEGDLPEGKSIKSNILATTEELVAVQSLAFLRGDIQPNLLEQELRSSEQVPHSAQPMLTKLLNHLMLIVRRRRKKKLL